jgi:hypothetical protein
MMFTAIGTARTERALFVVDDEGIARYSFVSPVGVTSPLRVFLKTLHAVSQKKGNSHECQ